jgi:hypothetical protein
VTKFLTIGVIATMASAAPSLAESLKPSAEKAQTELKKAEAVVGASGPIERAGGASSFSALQFSSEQGETTASLGLSFNLKRYEPVETDREGFYNVSSLKLNLNGEVPIDDSKTGGKIFSGDSLLSGTKIKLSLNRFSTTLGDGRGVEDIENRSFVLCVHKEAKVWQKANASEENIEKYDKFLTEYSMGIRNSTPSNALTKITKEFPDISGHIKPICFSGEARDIVYNYNRNQFEEYDKGYFDHSASQFMGLDASLAKDSYSLLNRAGFSKDSVNRTSWEVGAFYGWIGSDLSWSVRGRLVYGKSYKSPEEAQICRAVAGSTDPECLSAPDGKPKSSKSGLGSFEARKLFRLDADNVIGVAPQITYSIEEKNLGLEVPIYLSRDKDNKLNGGLKFSYASKGDDFAIGLFVGVPFSIFYN